ncbi:MAG: prepilin peptidase [Candidatus Binataceae bacterium]
MLGSFVSALTYRLPRGESVAHGRSGCPACGHSLSARDLVPLLSWTLQRGRCRYCGAGISWRYPAIEFTTMALFVAGAVMERDWIHLAALLAMTSVMVAAAVIDLEHRRLPESVLLVLAVLALTWRWNGDGDVATAFFAAASIFAIAVLINAGFRAATGASGLGMGDAKLMAASALALPLGQFFLYLTLAGVLGVALGFVWWRRTHTSLFPFGPALLVSLWTTLIWGDPILFWLGRRLS